MRHTNGMIVYIDPGPCQDLRRRSSGGRLVLTGGGKGGLV